MALNDVDRAIVLKALDEAKPYIGELGEVEQLIEEQCKSAHSVSDFIERIQHEHDRVTDPILRTDLRIYLGRLRSRRGN